MRKRRLTEDQMVTILREAERTSEAVAAKNHKVSEPNCTQPLAEVVSAAGTDSQAEVVA